MKSKSGSFLISALHGSRKTRGGIGGAAAPTEFSKFSEIWEKSKAGLSAPDKLATGSYGDSSSIILPTICSLSIGGYRIKVVITELLE